jgi:hypothetical protein
MLCKGSGRLSWYFLIFFGEYVVQGEWETFLVFFDIFWGICCARGVGDFLGIFWGICCARGVGDFLGIFWGIFCARGVGDFLGIFWRICCARGVGDFLDIFWGRWMQTTYQMSVCLSNLSKRKTDRRTQQAKSYI